MRLFSSGWSIRDGQVTTHFYLAQNCNISNKTRQNLIFYQHSQPLYDAIRKEIDNLEFVQGVNFKFRDSLRNNCTKYLLFFDDSCEEICNLVAFVDIATAGQHRGLSTIYKNYNLFRQSKHGRDVELQNTHIVLFKSPRDVMQVSTLSAQLGLGSELVH